jgi:lipid II:glycine glycyltransferase (peptidoglycan interpeptide bridge formation enzyme)
MDGTLTWRDDLGVKEWDEALTSLGGHPLQSAHWGKARQRVDGHGYVALAGFRNNEPVWMARVETRRLPLFGSIAWIPRGPTATGECGGDVQTAGLQRLASMGFILCASSPWRRFEGESFGQRMGPRTIWIDLGKGRDQLWADLHKKWRHGVGYAARAGVQVRETHDSSHVREFFRLCRTVSIAKGFALPASEQLMGQLLEERSHGPVSSHLFIAGNGPQVAAGAFIVKCGRSIHYFWGATDRNSAMLRAGEAVQWAVVEWGLTQGCTLYDLEGIDPSGNPGVYEFKRKMGGSEIALEPMPFFPLGWRGTMIAPLLRRWL